MSSGDMGMNVDSEDEFDWEEVEVPERQHLEITLDIGKPKNDDKANKKRGISHAERIARIDCHKIHTIVLICNAKVRNSWVNDPLLQARLLSLTPLHLQNAFNGIHKSRVPDQNQRGRMFERAMEQLTKWWADTFFEVIPEGHIRNHTFEEIQQKLEIRGLHLPEDDNLETPLDLESLQDIVDDEPEIIRSPKSLMKHALMQTGSRDISAQLFTALCRGLGIPARLVVSIQSVPWKAGIDRHRTQSKPRLKGQEMVGIGYQSSDPGSSSVDPGAIPMSEKAKGKQKANTVRLRKTKSKRQVLTAVRDNLEPPDPLTTPPVFWTEVFSRPDSKWFPMDPIRGIVNNRKVFDPTPLNTGPGAFRTKIENRMLYVLAFEEDGYARDVTRRYAKQYGARVAKLQGGSNAPNIGGGGNGRMAWWDRVVNFLHRPFRLNRDDLEDQELDAAQLMEGMPTTISGFKDHPLYVLERHLKQTETIYPPPPMTTELGKFRGEPVYSRSAVVSLKTAENWLRTKGRNVKEGEQPMKMVKVRPNTINKMRELEVLKDDLKVAGSDSPSGEGTSSAAAGDVMQGLYAFSQTEMYIPVPVIDGVVPKNNFGNIDLYVPSMLPQGAVHVPFKGVAKVAKKLGFDYAETVTGFEFRKRRAFPVIEGVVVAAENEAVLLEAYWETEMEAEEKARARKRERVLKQWIRLVHGLRIRQKLQEQYGSRSTDRNELDADKKIQEEGHVQDDLDDLAGGFLAGADRVVTTFHLPKKTMMSSPPRQRASRLEIPSENEKGDESDMQEELELKTYDLDEESMDADTAGTSSLHEGVEGRDFVPKTMQQMAEDAAKQEKEQGNEHRWDGTGQTGTGVILQQAADSTSTSMAKSIGRVTRSRSGAIKSETISNPSPEASKTARGRSSFTSWKGASANRTKRKRRRGVSESEDDAETSHGDGGREMDVGDDEQTDEAGISDVDEGRHHATRTSSNKRPRNGRTTKRSAGKANAKTSAALAISSPTMTTGDAGTSGRTLRPRTSKTTAQIEQERQVEEAHRRAVAR